jgi:hypothetical protein
MSATLLKKFGLRFKQSDGPILRALVDRVRSGDLRGDAATFEQAAISAEHGEPLEVECTPHEAQLLAFGYARNGTSLPAIDELNG